MSAFSAALIPVLTLILVGYILKRADFLPREAWSGIEKLTYFVLFPALLIRTLGNQSLAGVPWPTILLVVVSTLMLAAIVLILISVTNWIVQSHMAARQVGTCLHVRRMRDPSYSLVNRNSIVDVGGNGCYYRRCRWWQNESRNSIVETREQNDTRRSVIIVVVGSLIVDVGGLGGSRRR